MTGWQSSDSKLVRATAVKGIRRLPDYPLRLPALVGPSCQGSSLTNAQYVCHGAVSAAYVVATVVATDLVARHCE